MTRPEIDPERLYPLAVYCTLADLCRETGKIHCSRGVVKGATKIRNRWYVPGAAILTYFRKFEPAPTPESVRTTAKQKRVRAAMDKALAAV